MSTVRDHLDRVLQSSEERVRISRTLRDQSREFIRRSHQAVLQSQEVIQRSDRVLHEINREHEPAERLPLYAEPAGPGNLLQLISGQTLQHETVVMDGKHFVDCLLVDCILEYSGQALVLETTEFTGCSFRFKGEAAQTMNFLGCFGLIGGPQADCAVVPTPTLRSQRPN